MLYPPDEKWWVKTGRFLNVLDDQQNKLSPVKINAWASTAAMIGAACATFLSWLAGHLGGLEVMWEGVLGWGVQAHVTHQFDKRNKNEPPAAG